MRLMKGSRQLALLMSSIFLLVPRDVKDFYLAHVVSKMKDLGTHSAIIFVSTLGTCQLLSLLLEELGHEVAALHSMKSQALWLSALHWFKSGQAPILIATDIATASRGLDIPPVDHDIPRFLRDYVHHVGRTARAGRRGLAVSFVSQYDVELIQEIEAVIGKQLESFECKENEVLADIKKVYIAQRASLIKMRDDGFEERAQDRKK